MSEIYEDSDMINMGEKPTTFQLTRALRSRMKMVAHLEGFPTMIAWFMHQVEEAEKRIKSKNK